MDKEVLFPGVSRQRAPAPGCRPQILSHSAFLFWAADCAGSAACATSVASGVASDDVSSDISGDVSGGASRQISHRPFKASGNRKSESAILRII